MAAVQSPSLRAAQLADQAATAALYVTHPERKAQEATEVDTHSIKDSRITRKYQSAFNLSCAGAAASLAHAKSRPSETWKPEKQAAAEIAASHARIYQLTETPQALQSSIEGYKAALCVTRDRKAGSRERPVSTLSLGDDAEIGRTGSYETRREADGAMLAAAGAFSTGQMRRSGSAPPNPALPDKAEYALSAAGASHWPMYEMPVKDIDLALEASRIHHIASTNARLYASAPPVSVETEEQNKRDMLRAAAISMAQDMFAITQARGEPGTGPDAAVHAAQAGHQRAQSQKFESASDELTLSRAIALQEAAQKLATEKLARMKSETDAYQDYYGTGKPKGSRLSVRRKRTASDANASADKERSTEIRNQMSSLQKKLTELDEKKQKDRDYLMEAARRNVDATMHQMDMQMYAETGKPPPELQKEWEEKARERALLESESSSQAFVRDRVNIGSGQFLDRADVEAIARSRLQPTFDEITDRAEERRTEELGKRLDEEHRRWWQAIDRGREADLRAEEKRQKAAKKQEAKAEKGRLWRRKSKRARPNEAAQQPTDSTAAADETTPGPNEPVEPRDEQPAQTVETADSAASERILGEEEQAEEQPIPARSQEDRPRTSDRASGVVTDSSPRSESRIKSWFKGRMHRRSDSSAQGRGRRDTARSHDGSHAEGGAATSEDGTHVSDGASHAENGSELNRMQTASTNRNGSVSEPNAIGESARSKSRNDDRRRSRLRNGFMRMVSKNKQEPTTDDIGAARESEASSESSPQQQADRENFRDSSVDFGLPIPPALGERASSPNFRESRFAEDI